VVRLATGSHGGAAGDISAVAAPGVATVVAWRLCRKFSLARDFGYDRSLISSGRRHERGSAITVSFKGAHFIKDIILTCVRWYVAYPLSDRQVEARMEERGVSVDHATINRWS
jgi:hypothetical protein